MYVCMYVCTILFIERISSRNIKCNVYRFGLLKYKYWSPPCQLLSLFAVNISLESRVSWPWIGKIGPESSLCSAPSTWMSGTRGESFVFVLVSALPPTLPFSSIELNSLRIEGVPPLTDASLEGVLNLEVGGDPGVQGNGFMYEEICTDRVLSERLVRSSIDIMLGSDRSSSRDGLGRSRLVDVTVKERLTVMPRSPDPDASRSGVDALDLRRPKQHLGDSRQLFGMSRSASFFLDEAVVPKTTNRKMPGVVPGMKRTMVCIARPALRSGAEAIESLMLF
jgi:hypothetical protein